MKRIVNRLSRYIAALLFSAVATAAAGQGSEALQRPYLGDDGGAEKPDTAVFSNNTLLQLLNDPEPVETPSPEERLIDAAVAPEGVTPAQEVREEEDSNPALRSLYEYVKQDDKPQPQAEKRKRSRKKGADLPEWWSDPTKLPIDTTIDVSYMTMPDWMKLPAVFDTYSVTLPLDAYDPISTGKPTDVPQWEKWSSTATARDRRWRLFLQQWMLQRPDLVRYNTATMERPPRHFVMTVDPSTAKINVAEFDSSANKLKESGQVEANIQRINWLHSFDASLQFSQAYLSPNWYQGGNSNLNAIASVSYGVKLNPAFHKNLIFETSMQYKLGMNNAPDDSLHQYNISDDILQINSMFGVRAAHRWYYSVNGMFKTQLLNNYRKNTNDMLASFLSPGELNVGVGMTYSYANQKKTAEFNASISPLSYKLKTCINSKINAQQFGIKEGHTSVSTYGSSTELTFRWKLRYNIEYFSRLFAFTNYEYVQGDWENTVTFNISRFLTTKIYAHLRYDSSTKRVEGTRWHRWQLKEILSIGFSYRFQRG